MSLLKQIINEVGEVGKVGELVNLLRCSELPTLIVEDASDVRIYSQFIEQRLFGTYKVDVLSVGGKNNLLNLYDRRSEFSKLPVVFIVNKAMLLFSKTQTLKHYANIIFTKGYSIENEIYSKGGMEKYIRPDKIQEHWIVRQSIIKWFAVEVEAYLSGNYQESKQGLDEIIPSSQTELDKVFYKNRRYPDSQTIAKIQTNYRLKLPGKLLFEILERFSDISLDALYSIALVNYISKPQVLIEKIKGSLDEQRSVSSQEILPKSKKQKQNSSIQQPINFKTSLLSSQPKSKANFTVNKLVSDLKNSALPTLLVEGKDNAQIIEKLVEQNDILNDTIDVRTVVGRDTLLAVYDRRDEFVHILPVAFVANQEMWLFSGIPKRYTDIIWTQGYSLKNDLYASGDLESLLAPYELWKHQQVLNSTIKWFAFEVEEFLAGRPPKVDVELSDFIHPNQLELNKKFQSRNFYQPQDERIQKIKEAYKYMLPGKFLYQILARFLNTSGRRLKFDVTDLILQDITLIANNTDLILQDISVIANNFNPLNNLIDRITDKLFFRTEQLSNSKTSPANTKPRKTENQNNTSKLRKTQPHKPLKPIIKPKVKVGDIIIAEILKNEESSITVLLKTDHNEVVVFTDPYFPRWIQIGEETKLKVISLDNAGKVNKVTPELKQTQFPRTLKPMEIPKIKIGDKINAKIVKNDGIKVTVQLMTDNHEKITFEHPYFPGQVGEEKKLKIIAVDSTGRVTKVTL